MMMRERFPEQPKIWITDEEALEEISLDPKTSYIYALNFIKGRFERGETAIARSAKYSFRYAINILKRRFEKGEKVIKGSVYRDSYKEYFKIDDF